jgi:hypothetical protein
MPLLMTVSPINFRGYYSVKEGVVILGELNDEKSLIVIALITYLTLDHLCFLPARGN